MRASESSARLKTRARSAIFQEDRFLYLDSQALHGPMPRLRDAVDWRRESGPRWDAPVGSRRSGHGPEHRDIHRLRYRQAARQEHQRQANSGTNPPSSLVVRRRSGRLAGSRRVPAQDAQTWLRAPADAREPAARLHRHGACVDRVATIIRSVRTTGPPDHALNSTTFEKWLRYGLPMQHDIAGSLADTQTQSIVQES